MHAGNLRKLIVVFWRHPTIDWENARTSEFYEKLLYGSEINDIRRYDLEFIFANCHRQTESYARYRDTVELLRRHKIRREPLVYLELWTPNTADGPSGSGVYRGTKEELYSIDSDYRMNQVIQRIAFHLKTSL